MRGNQVNVPPEVIDNANYLQCVWAHSALFSNSNDFSFARRVFRDNPQYKTVPGISLHKKGVILEKIIGGRSGRSAT